MAMARSVLARVARGRRPTSQPLLPARAAPESPPSAVWMLPRTPAADPVGKRFLFDVKGRRYYSAGNNLPETSEFQPLSSIMALFGLALSIATVGPHFYTNLKRSFEDRRRIKKFSSDDKPDRENAY